MVNDLFERKLLALQLYLNLDIECKVRNILYTRRKTKPLANGFDEYWKEYADDFLNDSKRNIKWV